MENLTLVPEQVEPPLPDLAAPAATPAPLPEAPADMPGAALPAIFPPPWRGSPDVPEPPALPEPADRAAENRLTRAVPDRLTGETAPLPDLTELSPTAFPAPAPAAALTSGHDGPPPPESSFLSEKLASFPYTEVSTAGVNETPGAPVPGPLVPPALEPPTPAPAPAPGGREPDALPALPELAGPVSAPPTPSPALDTLAGDRPLPPGITPERPRLPLPAFPEDETVRMPAAPAPAPTAPFPGLPEPLPEPAPGRTPLGTEPAETTGMGGVLALLGEIADSLRALSRGGESQRPHAPALGPGYVPFPGLGGGDTPDGYAIASASADVSRLSGLRGAGGYGFGTVTSPDPRANFLEPLPRHFR